MKKRVTPGKGAPRLRTLAVSRRSTRQRKTPLISHEITGTGAGVDIATYPDWLQECVQVEHTARAIWQRGHPGEAFGPGRLTDEYRQLARAAQRLVRNARFAYAMGDVESCSSLLQEAADILLLETSE